MKIISLLAVDGCLSSTISTLLDAFTIANLWHKALSGEDSALFAVRVVTPDERAVNCNDCIQIRGHDTFAERCCAHYLIIPAFLPIFEFGDERFTPICDFIRSQYEVGTTVASICTGAFLLAETGLLDGRPATTHWQFEKKFRHRYPRVELRIGELLTERDRLICSGAVSAQMHLVLRIIRREGSARLASAWAKAMLVDPNTHSQAPYCIALLPERHRDQEVQKAERFMIARLSSIRSVDQIAQSVCLSPRHFKRRFKQATGESPLNYLQKLRIHHARELLENSLDSVDEISRRVGYEDSSAFRRLFKRHTSLSPREYRNRFSMVNQKAMAR